MLREWMRHRDMLDRLGALGMYGERPGVELAAELLSILGHPEDGLSMIHVAGTNGKGSTVFYTGEILSRLAYRVGSYTSPSLSDLRERIAVNGEWIGEEDFDRLAQAVLAAADEQMTLLPTASDVLLAMGLLYFKEQGCDIVLLETGLGGRLDSTAAVTARVPAPVSCITRIGLDHTAILGDTIERIAAEKAGILRKGTRAVLASMPRAAYDVLAERCRELGIPYRAVAEERDAIQWIEDFFPGLARTYQRDNLANAIAIVRTWATCDPANAWITKEAIWHTFDTSFPFGPPGRLSVVAERPRIIVDGAHNPDGAAALYRALYEAQGGKKLIGVVAIVKDKDAEGMLAEMAPLLAVVYLTAVGEGARRTDVDALLAICEKYKLAVRVRPTVADAIEHARDRAFWDERSVVVFGSLALAGQAVRLLSE